MFAFPVLLGDIGGTNARFGVLAAPGQAIELLPHTLTASAPSPVEAIRALLATHAGPAPRSAIIAVATRVDKPVIRLTNAAWTIDAEAIASAFGLDRVVLVNDYTPVAASVVALDEAKGHLARLGPPLPARDGTRVVLGPGTGLGAGALVPIEDRLAIFATEAGHMEFGPSASDEMTLWPLIDRVGGRVSAEVVLSGPGLLRLARALAGQGQEACPFGRPNEVLDGARSGHPLGLEAVRLFARCLGRFAGDLALTFEAIGGVFIAGGIAPRMCDVLQEGGFREAFERKAPHDAWARQVPAFVITHPEPALLGLSAIVEDPKRFVFHFQGWSALG
jgi:glucokinase